MSAPRVPGSAVTGGYDLGRVYVEHRAACQRHAQRIVRDRQLAEDVVQDVFVMLWQTQGGSYRPDQGPLGTWLQTVVHHKAVDAVRKSKARRRLLTQVGRALEFAGGNAAVHDTVWDALRAQEVRHAAAALSPAQREVLSLAYHHGLTQSQISARLGVPLGTVKTRTRAGLLRLRWPSPQPSPHRPPNTTRTRRCAALPRQGRDHHRVCKPSGRSGQAHRRERQNDSASSDDRTFVGSSQMDGVVGV